MINVNNAHISEKEFDMACHEYRRQLKKDKLERKEYLAIANQLIDAALFLQNARETGVTVADSELDTAYKNIEAQYSSPAELEDILSKAGESRDSFREKLLNDLLFIFDEFVHFCFK